MSRTLYIFVKSTRPDQYLNPALHCIKYENVTKVVYSYINESMESGDKVAEIPLQIQRRVRSLLHSLGQDGIYKYFDNGKKDKDNLIDYYTTEEVEKIKDFYSIILDKNIQWTTRVIEYLDLKDELKIIQREKDCLFDVTALNKKHLADIIAISIIEGFHNIYTFDLEEPPNFKEPWKSLIYDLITRSQTKVTYKYVNIVKTTIFRECANSILIRKMPLKISLIITPIFILPLLYINFVYGPTNLVIQTVSILSAAVSILSVIYTIAYSFLPQKK